MRLQMGRHIGFVCPLSCRPAHAVAGNYLPSLRLGVLLAMLHNRLLRRGFLA
jgi:hypothetical protein